MAPHNPYREIYKQRVIEAELGGGKQRRFHAYVDGIPADSFTRYGTDLVTTSFGSRKAALDAAKNAVDSDIRYQSHLRRNDPKKAVERAEGRHAAAIRHLDLVQQEFEWKSRLPPSSGIHSSVQQKLDEAQMRLRRTSHDLDLALKAQTSRVPPTED